MGCRHESVTGFVRWWTKIETHPLAPRDVPIFVLLTLRSVGSSTHDVDAIRCNHCNAWLPLGPSNDEPEAVRVEMRAAEIAANGEPIWTEHATGSEVREGCGWNARACGFADTWCSGNPDALAGYLARCIATHTEDK